MFSTLRSAGIVIFLTAAVAGVHEGVSHMRPANDAVEPGDDFYAYANGDWLAKARIPPGKGRWGARDEIAAATAQQVSYVVRHARSLPQGDKLADFFSAYLDERSIEEKGALALKASLEEIERIRDTTELSRYLGARLRADVDPLGTGVCDSAHLFGIAASYGLHGDAVYMPYLTQGGLGLATREAYLGQTVEMHVARNAYRQYIGRMLRTAGFDDAAQRARDVLTLEIAIARSHASATDSAKDSNAENYWARGDFGLEAPGLDWRAFFAAAGLGRRGDFVVWQPDAIKGTAALVGSTPLPVWKDYLRLHLLDREAEFLPRRFADLAQAFHAANSPRRQRAIDAASRLLPEEVGRLYVARYFPAERKARVQAILDQVVAASKRRVVNAAWMTPDARRTAAAKLDAMYFGVGYPDQWPDTVGLVIDPQDAIGNARRIERWRYQRALSKLGRDVDRREWAIAAHTPGAILNFQLNAYNFAAALLQAPKFDFEASDAANYGAIGAIFAHELTHFFDTLGADYDAQGATRTWWTTDDKARYAVLTQPLVAQYAAYRPLPDAAIDGSRTLVENFADLAGLAAAFEAHRAALDPGLDPDALLAKDREFFLGFARSWRAAMNDDAVRVMVKGDGHAPERYRINTVRNMDAWYEAFDVQPGQRLYLPPQERVRVW
jgi:putative endopeptidase